jgi:hypothetical protein
VCEGVRQHDLDVCRRKFVGFEASLQLVNNQHVFDYFDPETVLYERLQKSVVLFVLRELSTVKVLVFHRVI